MATANHILLRRITLSASASSVTFDSIPQTGYTDLKIVVSARGASTNPDNTWLRLSFNGSTTGFTYKKVYGNGTGAFSDSGQDIMPISSTTTANTFSNGELYIPGYTTGNYKSVSIDAVGEDNAAKAYAALQSVLWSNGSAITSITLTGAYGDIAAGSSFSLYGIADVNTTPKLAPKADGGDIIRNDGTYWYHTFTGAGIFRPQLNLTCDYLVVAGGGGGGTSNSNTAAGGGGGAGGYRAFTSQALTGLTSYPVIIGAGGASAASGTTSSFNSISTSGGGAGGGGGGSNGVAGGSGGGASRAGATFTGGAGNTGGYTPVEGYKGGDAAFNSAAAGGGGSSSAGVNLTAAGTGTNGGNGTTSSITGTAYAGGGGGGSYTGYPVASGQAGGGNGGVAGNGSNATAATGSGGGGAGSNASTAFSGGNGGSGVVVIRYAMA